MMSENYFPIVQQFIPENDDHQHVRISSCKKDDLLALIPNGRTIQQKNSIYDYFSQGFTYFEDKKGLYFRRHLSFKFYKPLCLIIFYKESSLNWWKSLKSMKREEENKEIKTIPDFFMIDFENSSFISTIMEIPANWVIHYINYARKINGWEIENPPFDIVSIGNEEVPFPLLSQHMDDDMYGEDCIVQLTTYEGSVIDVNVVEGGSGYFIDDNLSLLSATGKRGVAIVRRVKNGVVVEAEIIKNGYNYQNGEIVNTFTNKNTPFYPFHHSNSTDGLLENINIFYINLPE